jgi:polyisoprenoid-binding protein YceI
MNSYETSASNSVKKIGKFKRSFYSLGLFLAATSFSLDASASCKYILSGQWETGFNGKIEVTNTGSAPVNTWTINWAYSGNNRIINVYTGNLSGTNPYSVTNFAWNGTINPGETILVGFNGSKTSGAAENPVITGGICGTAVSSSSSSLVVQSSSSSSAVKSSSSSSSSAVVIASSSSSKSPSSSSKSSIASSVVNSSLRSSSSSSIGGALTWQLNTDSHLNFTTAKNVDNVEVQTFNSLSGKIDFSNNSAELVIDLNSVNTGNATRDENIRTKLFETTAFPVATVKLNLPNGLLTTVAVGQTLTTDVSANLDLHGLTGVITTKVSFQRLSNSRILVQSWSPVLLKTSDYSLTAGLETLRAIVGLSSISTIVPVNFSLFFDAPI